MYDLVEYKGEELGDVLVPRAYVTEDGVKLGQWVGVQRKDYKNDRLSAVRVAKLEEVNFVWDASK